MADQPNVINTLINPIQVQSFERALPTAFDEGFTLLEKVNKMIVALNQIGRLSNNVLDQWNQVMDWVMADGLDASVNSVLQGMETDGTLAKIINIDLLNAKADITYVDSQISSLTNTLNSTTTSLTTSVNNTVNTLQSSVTNNSNILANEYVNAMYPPSPLVGIKDVSKDAGDQSARLQAIIDLGHSVFIPEGTFHIASTINLKHCDFIGSGTETVFDIDGCDGFMIVNNNAGRKVTQIGNFRIISSRNNTANFSAIRFQELSAGTYTIGCKFHHIEIGGGGTFGAGFRITDAFRTSLSHIGMTNCLNAVIIYGQAVETSLFDVTSNQEAPNTVTSINGGERTGLKVTTSNHTGSSLSPESVKVVNCNFVGHDWGIRQDACTYASYENIELDYNVYGGFYVASGLGGCTFKNAWIANYGGVQATYGIYVATSDFDRNPLKIEDVHISWIATANINSIGVYTEAYRRNVKIKDVSVMGGANIKYGFRLNSPQEMVFESNTVKESVTTAGDYVIDGVQRSIFNYNAGNTMTLSGDGSWMVAKGNMLTLNTSGSNTVNP